MVGLRCKPGAGATSYALAFLGMIYLSRCGTFPCDSSKINSFRILIQSNLEQIGSTTVLYSSPADNLNEQFDISAP
jgi:hypothetical protein